MKKDQLTKKQTKRLLPFYNPVAQRMPRWHIHWWRAKGSNHPAFQAGIQVWSERWWFHSWWNRFADVCCMSPLRKHQKNRWAVFKTFVTFHYPGWLIGILIPCFIIIPIELGRNNALRQTEHKQGAPTGRCSGGVLFPMILTTRQGDLEQNPPKNRGKLNYIVGGWTNPFEKY